jgi:rod shape-determining protein MreB
VYNLDIGERTAENIKIQVGSAYEFDDEREVEVRGRDVISGLPKTVSVSSIEIRAAIAECVSAVVEAVKSLLERTPPELSSDIIERGIYLTGGGALLHGLDRLLELETGIPVRIADDPISCVAMGTGQVLEEVDFLHRHARSMEGYW